LVKSKTLIRDVSGEDLGKDLEELLDYNYDEYDTEEHDADDHDHDDDDYSYDDDEYEDPAPTNQTDPTPPTQIEATPISLPDPKQTEQELKIENDKILQESLVGGISQVKGLQNMKKELDERLRDLTPEQFMQYKNFKNCTYTILGLNKNNHELAGNYVQLFQNFYKNTNFSALSNCFPDNFDQESLRAISKVALNQDEKFLEEFLSEIEKLLKTKNFENLVKFVVILDNSRDEQIYVGNFYAGLKKAIKELRNGKIDGLKQFFAYSDCLSKRENFTYSDLVDITPSDFYASGVSFDDLWSMAVCNGQASLKAMALEEIQERGLEVFDWGMKLLSATFGEDEKEVKPLGYQGYPAPQENESPVGVRRKRNATVDFDYESTTPTEPKKMPKTSDLIKQLPTLLSSLFTFDMENFGTIEAWNTRIKKLQSQLENNQCLVKFFATEKNEEKN